MLIKLAWSQLRRNPMRSGWTVAAIVLSTALTTMVATFVVCAHGMLEGMLGKGYGQYGQTYTVLLGIPALVLGLMVAVMAIVVITNVFRISARERMQELGLLKCVGATPRQIGQCILYEGVLLAAVGIPLGILAGLGLSAIGIAVVNNGLDALNALSHIMIKKLTFHLTWTVSPPALVASAAVSFVTVLVSAWRPAQQAAKASAVENVQGARTIRLPKHESLFTKAASKLFGAEGWLAAQNLSHNRQTFRATVTALAVGIVLFVLLGFLQQQADAVEALVTPRGDFNVTADYQSAYEETEGTLAAPITAQEGEAITKELAAFEGDEVWGVGTDYETFDVTLPAEALTKDALTLKELGEAEAYTFDVELILLDNNHYQAMCKKAGVPEGSVLLLNHEVLNLEGHATDIVPFNEKLRTLTLKAIDGTTKTVPIAAMVPQEDIPDALFYPNTNPVRLVVPEGTVRGYTWQVYAKDVDGLVAHARTVLDAHYPTDPDSYMKDGYSARVYETADYYQVMNITIMIALLMIACFSAMLMLIGLTNVVSTLSTNVLMRGGEMAVLQSVGMTPEGVGKMLALESILCAVKAIVIGVPIGIALTMLINLPLRAMLPVPYEWPLVSIGVASAGIIALTWGITKLAGRKWRKQNIIEHIRRVR